MKKISTIITVFLLFVFAFSQGNAQQQSKSKKSPDKKEAYTQSPRREARPAKVSTTPSATVSTTIHEKPAASGTSTTPITNTKK